MGQVALGENNAYYALFLIYEVLLLKIPSANRQFCDTGLLFFFLRFFESEPLSRSGGVSRAAVRAQGRGGWMGGRVEREGRLMEELEEVEGGEDA